MLSSHMDDGIDHKEMVDELQTISIYIKVTWNITWHEEQDIIKTVNTVNPVFVDKHVVYELVRDSVCIRFDMWYVGLLNWKWNQNNTN